MQNRKGGAHLSTLEYIRQTRFVAYYKTVFLNFICIFHVGNGSLNEHKKKLHAEREEILFNHLNGAQDGFI